MKLIIFYHLKDSYCLSYPVLFNYLGIKKNKEMLKQHNIELIDFRDFLSKKDRDLLDQCNKNNIEIEPKAEFIKWTSGAVGPNYGSYVAQAVSNLVDIMRNSDIYNNSILLGFQNMGSDWFFCRKGLSPFDWYDIFKSKNCKLMFWYDDLHGFPGFPKIDDYDRDSDYSKCSDWRLDLADKILTPSRHYYELINSQYLNKTIHYFYSLNEDWFPQIDINNFKTRKNKILLSGAIGSYPTRVLLQFIKINRITFHNLIELLDRSSEDRTQSDFRSKTGINYLKHICTYKGAFYATAFKPLNFGLAKIIEILMCGTIGFFEFSPLLEKELGLIAFKHYVPITDKDGELINNSTYYLKYLNSKEGEQIALNGANYIRSEFSSEKRMYQLISILKEYE